MVASALIFVVVVPLLLAAATAVVVRQLNAPPRIVWAVGTGIGYAAGHFSLKGQAGFGPALRSFVSPHEARDWLPLVALLAMGVTIVRIYAPPEWRRWTVILAVLHSIGVPIRLLAGPVAQSWTLWGKLAHLALLPSLFGLVWMLLASVRDDDQPIVRPFLIVVVAAAAAVVIALSGSLVNGKSCGVLAAALTGTAIAAAVGAVFRSDSGSPTNLVQRIAGEFAVGGAAAVVTFSLGSLILLGHYYSELSATNVALLVAGLVIAGGPLPRFMLPQPAWFGAAIRAVLCLLPLLIAIATSAG